MDILTSIIGGVRQAWRILAFGPFEKGVTLAMLVAIAIYVIVFTIERLTGTRTANYRSKSFLHDLGYWFYYRAGIHGLLLVAPATAIVDIPLSFVETGLFTPLPYVAHLLIIFVGSDFAAYWIHRAEHRFKFMWAFHTTHHSQERLNFATIARFHPVEMLYHNILVYIPLRILGLDPTVWLPLFLFSQLHGGITHTKIPWKLGPLYKIVATPTFHSFHHSVDPAHHNKNFSSMFSIWDHLFGTAVNGNEAKPSRFGLDGIPSTPLLSTLTTPFRLLYESYLVPLRGRGMGKS